MKGPTRRPTPTPTSHPPLSPEEGSPTTNEQVGRGVERAPTGVGRQRRLPFALHQGLEYALAALLVDLGIHSVHGGLLFVAAAAFVILAATARGPLGILRLVGPSIHKALDVTVPVLIGLAPIWPAMRPDLGDTILLELLVLVWLRVTTLTSYRARTRTPATGAKLSALLVTGDRAARMGARIAGRRLGRLLEQANFISRDWRD